MKTCTNKNSIQKKGSLERYRYDIKFLKTRYHTYMPICQLCKRKESRYCDVPAYFMGHKSVFQIVLSMMIVLLPLLYFYIPMSKVLV